MPEREYDAIIVGGGAAGLFCAIHAGRRGLRVAVLEHNAEVGRKIVISGGGRCNFTNIQTRAENFVSQNPHFCKSALAGFTPQDFVEIVRRHHIAYYEKKLGQLFCRDSSRPIVEMLLAECAAARVKVITSCRIENIDRGKDFCLATTAGRLRSAKLVVACGGLSFPKIGATGFGYDVARQFGLRVVDTRPSLVALVAKDGNFSGLAGISVDSLVTAGGEAFRENILFTHRGLSGPAILQASNYWRPDDAVEIDLAPGIDVAELLLANHQAPSNASTLISRIIPARLADEIAPAKKLSELGPDRIKQIARSINHWTVKFIRTEGYERAEVTLGGVSTAELSSKTMESRRVAGLYFIGEVVDVTGWLGGYNFQWAWASAYAAAKDL